MGEMYDFSLAMMDSTQILIPYCYAIDASPLLTIGRQFGQLKSKPANRLYSYIGALNEIVHSISNHIAGAVAISTFFMDSASILINKEKLSLEDLKNNNAARKDITNYFQSFVHGVNSLSRQTHESPFTNISVFSPVKLRKLLSDDGRKSYWMDADGNCLIDTDEGMEYAIEYILEIQKIFMNFFDAGDPMEGGINYRFPVVTINIAKTVESTIADDEDKEIIHPDDAEFVRDICEREIYRYNIMVSAGEKTASCCRLLSDKEMMDSFAGQVNSFGGSAISMGSHRVVTVNLNRIALEVANSQGIAMLYNDIEDRIIEYFKTILKIRLTNTVKILRAHKNIMMDFKKANLFPYATHGWITLQRMFSTVGIMGIYESCLTLKEFAALGDEFEEKFIAEMLTYINDTVKSLSTEYSLPINIEQIPGETMAVKLCKADRMIFGETAVPFTLYSNQFVPLWENVDIWERMRLDGKYNKLLTGGGIVHFNLGERPTSAQIFKLIEHSIETGSEHFALNPVYSKCENDHVIFGDVTRCPTCGSHITEKYTRVVGFFTPISSWVKERREWEFIRRRFEGISEKVSKKAKELSKDLSKLVK